MDMIELLWDKYASAHRLTDEERTKHEATFLKFGVTAAMVSFTSTINRKYVEPDIVAWVKRVTTAARSGPGTGRRVP